MIKNKNIVWLVFGLAVVMLGACKKYEQFPVEKIILEDVFDKRDSSGKNAQLYLYTIYEVMKNGHNGVDGNYLDAASDDAITSQTGTQVENLAIGAFDAFSFPTGGSSDNLWSSERNYYQGIRRCNEFINNIEVVPVKSTYNGYSQKYLWRNEARFLRAYFYFEMVKRFGGVPMVGNNVFSLNDDLNIPRSSFEDCINYIVNECDAIKDTLLSAPVSNSDSYRVSKGAALALKAQVLLYAASPLFNGGNIDANNPLTGYVGAADKTRWARAAAAAKDVIDLNAYSLINIRDIFLTSGGTADNREVIFARQASRGRDIETNNGPVGYDAAPGAGRTSPTQDLVNAFPMNTGVAIDATGSGYNAQDPYSDRDPRLNRTVLHDQSLWLNSSLQTYEGGRSKPNQGNIQTRTGYYLRKFMGNFENETTYGDHFADWVIYRYAQVLLDYAEASNEADGDINEIYEILYDIRERAGIQAGGNGQYGLVQTANRDVLRDIIHNERRIELAFEGHRYFDIRRWKIAEDVMNTPREGMVITLNPNTNVRTYTPTDVLQTRFIAPKMYLYPVPDAEVRKNSAIGKAHQNPGW
ncbi:MAG: RagB/SusD family nutrient uptake outer membrane protein [Sphingobacteriaceae bacterium]|nr:MAG: RagB/SusD family nutrient uptake outer membrane protein [Sphingobacteriaceae bacterium]